MTAMAMNYVVNPLSNFWDQTKIALEILGYSRAASELARLGYMQEAKNCMMMIKELKGL